MLKNVYNLNANGLISSRHLLTHTTIQHMTRIVPENSIYPLCLYIIRVFQCYSIKVKLLWPTE